MNATDVLAEITQAFQEEPYPGELNIVYDNSGYHLECIQIRELFKPYTWQQVPQQVLVEESTGIAFMSESGFQYYLPAYLCFILSDYAEGHASVGMIVRLLTLPAEIDVALLATTIRKHQLATKLPGVDFHEYIQNRFAHFQQEVRGFISRVGQFSPAQGSAILHFLEYVQEAYREEFLYDEPAIAIERYWFQFS